MDRPTLSNSRCRPFSRCCSGIHPSAGSSHETRNSPRPRISKLKYGVNRLWSFGGSGLRAPNPRRSVTRQSRRQDASRRARQCAASHRAEGAAQQGRQRIHRENRKPRSGNSAQETVRSCVLFRDMQLRSLHNCPVSASPYCHKLCGISAMCGIAKIRLTCPRLCSIGSTSYSHMKKSSARKFYITCVLKNRFTGSRRKLARANILLMIWEIHQGDRRPNRADELSPRSMLPIRHDSMCPACREAADEFMNRSADAVNQAGIKPDDQIWLSVFEALQRVLNKHGGCAMCAEQHKHDESVRQSGSHYPSAQPVDRLSHLKHAGKKAL